MLESLSQSLHPAAIDRRLRAIERTLRPVSERASAGMSEAADRTAESFGAALSSLIGKFRDGGDEARKFGREAARWGDDAFSQVAREARRNPHVFAVAVAVGAGLLVCLASRSKRS